MTSNQHCFSVPQRLLWKCQTSSFHLREILSDLLSPLFLSWGACLYRAMFHLNIKACEEVARHFKCHFLGFSQGMWLLKCPRRGDLITETMLPLWPQGNGNLYLSTLCCVVETKHRRPFASDCSTVWMRFEKLFTFLAMKANNHDGKHVPDVSYLYAAFTIKDCRNQMLKRKVKRPRFYAPNPN